MISLLICPSTWLYPDVVKAPARETCTCPSLLHNPCCKVTPFFKCFLRLLPPGTFSSQVHEKEGYLLAISLLILLLNEIIALSETVRSKWQRKDLGGDLAAADNVKVAQLSQLFPLLFLPGKGNVDLFWDWESLLAKKVKGSSSVFRSVTVTSHSLTFSALAHCCAASVSTCLCSRRSVLFPKTITVTYK